MKTAYLQATCAFAAFAIGSMGATPAWSQNAPAAGDPVSADTDIIVTATKRGVSVQDVPASITALSGDALDSRGIDDVESLSLAVPNLNFGEHAGASFITIRGVGSTINSGLTEPTVATYVDGIFLPRSTMGSLRAIDLERVEVLRGPQGTLYGRNATGGAVNFISAAPTNELSGMLRGSVGSRSAFGLNGFISGPLAEGVTVRLSGGHEEHDSYLRDRAGDPTNKVSSDSVRAAVRLEPSASATVDLFVKYEINRGADTYQQAFTASPALPASTYTIARNRTAEDRPFYLRHSTLMLGGIANIDLSDDVSLRSTTGYINHKARMDFDADMTSVPFFTAENFTRPSESISQDLTLLGSSDRLEWLVGAFAYQEQFSISLPVLFPAGVNTGDPATSIPAGLVAEQSVNERTHSFALYLDATYSLSDTVRASLGLRFNHESKRFRFRLGATIPGAGFFGVENVRSELNSDQFLPKVGLQFDLSPDTNLYVQYQRGFKSGGHNLSLDTLYDPETIDSYEIGLKSQLFDRSLTANVSGFFYDYQGLQITNNVGPTTTQVENANAHIYGLEGELIFQPTDHITFNLAGTYLHARYTEFTSFDAARPGLGFLDLSGLKVVRSPDFTLNAGVEARTSLNAGILNELSLRADFFYSDDVVLRYFATPQDIQKAYGVLNLSASLYSPDRNFEIRLFANNVTNNLYKRQIDYLQAISIYDGNWSEPRTFGAQATVRF